MPTMTESLASEADDAHRQEKLHEKLHDKLHAPHVASALGGRSIVLVGLMGAGKSSVGRRLSQVLGLPFCDADAEIEAAAGLAISEIFARYGEPYFRDREAKVLERLLSGPQHVLATGGGAFMSAETRALVRQHGVSLWLRADLDTLLRRVKRRNDRPLLKDGDPAETLRTLMDQRHPVYAEADITVESLDGPHEATLTHVLAALEDHLKAHA